MSRSSKDTRAYAPSSPPPPSAFFFSFFFFVLEGGQAIVATIFFVSLFSFLFSFFRCCCCCCCCCWFRCCLLRLCLVSSYSNTRVCLCILQLVGFVRSNESRAIQCGNRRACLPVCQSLCFLTACLSLYVCRLCPPHSSLPRSLAPPFSLPSHSPFSPPPLFSPPRSRIAGLSHGARSRPCDGGQSCQSRTCHKARGTAQ